MSASTFCDYFGPNAAQDVFPYRAPTGDFKALASITVPILVTFGKEKDALLIPAEEACNLLKQKAVRSANVQCALIEGASHSYLGREEALARVVADWVLHMQGR
jgi:pimeloyl-ACP methyl ester carboxylesterase